MDLSILIEIINNGIPAEIVGGVTSEMIVRLIDKAKAMFNGKTITKEELERLIVENDELKDTLINLQNEYSKGNIIINNAQKIKIKTQIINSTNIQSGDNSTNIVYGGVTYIDAKQIALDGAIETLPKLSVEQLNFLTFVFVADNLTVKLFQNRFNNDKDFDIHDVMNNIKKFCSFSSKDIRQHVVSHLQYLGCIREIVDTGDMFDSPTQHIKNLVEKYCRHTVEEREIAPILKSIHINFAIYYRLWRMRKERTIKLTTVGLVIAIIHYNGQTDANIKIEDFI